MNEINQRMIKILEVKFGGNVSEMARFYRIPQPTLNNIVGNRMSKPSFDNIEKLINSDETINPVWLITGKGSMTDEPKISESEDYKEKYYKLLEEKDKIHTQLTEALQKLLSISESTSLSKNASAPEELDVSDATKISAI